MKPTLVIAGPGAGKTYDMVKRIVEAIPQLDPTRVLAAITYTNAATESISSRICTVATVPPNVFVGTTYSFFNRFIIQPYASIFDEIGVEKLFLEIDIDALIDKRVPNKADYAARNGLRNRLVTRFLRDGHIPVSEIGRIAASIVQNNRRVREVLCNRLQFLFIDEFQDLDSWQFKVIDEIRKGNQTEIFVVGDPEQYISGYTYQNTTARKPKSFDGIPIQRFSANRHHESANFRSFEEIVRFTNRFHTELQQESRVGSCADAGVFFITKTDLDAIIASYRSLIGNTIWHTDNDSRPSFFYLSYENKTFGNIATKYDLTLGSSLANYSSNPFELASNLISSCIDMSTNQLKTTFGLSGLKYRELCVRLIRAVQVGSIQSEEDVMKHVSGYLNQSITVPPGTQLRNQLSQLHNFFAGLTTDSGRHQYSSIHKAKGLEAHGVLAVARTESELSAWFTTDKTKRHNDRNDRCRVGYVAFSRARQVLCIACQKQISENMLRYISSLEVQTLDG